MAQTAAERQSEYRRRQRERTTELVARNADLDARLRACILTAFGYDFCGTCHHHQIAHHERCYDCDCKGFVRATELEETEG